VTLASVDVNAERLSPLLTEFEENRKLGLGHFLDRAEIAKLEGSHLSTLLEQVPGARFVHANGGNSAWLLTTIVFSNNPYYPEKYELMKGLRIACYAQVFLDGTLMNRPVLMDPDINEKAPRGKRATPPFAVNSIPPTMIEAVEFYASPAQTPARYAGYGSECGVLVIHTRRAK
jgi:hypothetical protein